MCPNGPNGRHYFESIYVADNVAARIFCHHCGECRATEPKDTPLEDRPEWPLMRHVKPKKAKSRTR